MMKDAGAGHPRPFDSLLDTSLFRHDTCDNSLDIAQQIKSSIMQITGTLQKNPKERLFQIAILVIIAFGIILRLAKYLPAYSMRGDELAVTLNLVNRSPAELFMKPLDYEQAAPFGFVLLVKFLITIFGQSEYVLRLVAFASGCISLVLMQDLLSKTVSKYGNIFALAAFSFGNYLIYYSAELKQYSSDVLVCSVLLLIFYQHISRKTTAKDFFILAALGTLALCFSYPALFVTAGIGIVLFLHYWNHKQRLLWITLIGMIWAGTFLALYFLLLRHQTQDAYLITFWDNLLSFMPMPPWRDPGWFPKAASGMFSVVAGISSLLILIIPIYILGLWEFWKEKKWQWMLALTIPIALNVVVSGFEKYPFHGRLILYLLPLVFIVLGKGFDFLARSIHNQSIAAITFAILIMILLRPALQTFNSYLFTQSYLQDDLKPVLFFMQERKQNSDLLYLYHDVEQPYIYYAPYYHLENLSYVTGQKNARNAKKYDEELSALPRSQRIWFVFSFVQETRVRKGVKQDEREYILGYLKANGTLVNEYYSANRASSVHLFILK